MKKRDEAYTDLFQSIADDLAKCEQPLLSAKETIEGTDLIKKPTKRLLLARLEVIFNEANGIVQKLGQLGKVK